MYSGIYKITNTINNKCYIGSAVNFNKRFSAHKNLLNKNKHTNKHLQASYNLYGSDCFKYDILCFCSKEDLICFEQKYIDLLQPEYNICKVAGSILGYKHSEETKEKMSLADKGHRNRLGQKGHKGHKHSEETKEKMSSVKKGNQNHLGHKHSEEVKKKYPKALRKQGSCSRAACNYIGSS